MTIEPNEIEAALASVLASDKFVAAPQMTAFLSYVVMQTIEGNTSRIKAYTVAVDALGKPDTFDPQNDPVVRVLAKRLRTALDDYYKNNPQARLKIVMKPGSYVPVFTRIESPAESSSGSDVDALRSTGKGLTAPRHPPSVAPVDDQPEASYAATEPAASTQNGGFFGPVWKTIAGHPKTTLVMVMAVLAVVAGLQYRQKQATVPNILAALPENSSNPATKLRARPDRISIFVSTTNRENQFETQLNTIMSGVFSEAEHIFVHRVVGASRPVNYWPEDYLLSIDVLPVSSETRITVQLMDAQTGRVAHTQSLALSADASETLSSAELEQIMSLARLLVQADGPLAEDYRVKTQP